MGFLLTACGADAGVGEMADGGGLGPLLPGSFAGQNGTNPGGGDPEKICGVEKKNLQRLPGELLLVLDRSGSMRERPGATRQNPNPERKWTTVTSAIDEIVANTQGGVAWGLKLFPSQGQCGAEGPPAVNVAVNNHMALMSAIGRNEPERDLATPTRFAVDSATAHLKTVATPNPKFILLATDGQPNCFNGVPSGNTTDADGAVNAVTQAKAAGFATFVLGIAMTRGADEVLDRMAEAGGRARAGDVKYYPATSREELVAALTDIAGQVGSCQLTLESVPPSPEEVVVKADQMRVPRDPARQEGWNYGASQTIVELYGSWCTKLKAGELKDLELLFGCPGMIIE